ncbi:MAG: hypothetical protein ACJAZ1_002542 [Yoonia sp.]|jgi:hypothetical protein
MPPQDGYVRGVASSSGGLIRATLGSAVAAGAILTLFWLPAEYGIDATGLGSVMGLTEMGEIKQQLYAEAEADDATAAQAASVAIAPPTTTAIDQQVLERLAGIEAQISAIAAVVGTVPASSAVQPAPVVAPQPNVVAPDVVAVAPEPATPEEPVATTWRDEVNYTLAPSEGIEIKLVMEEGAVAQFEWTANGAVLNYDTHGDGGGQGASYEQGRGVPEQSGQLVAAFTGNHGWFWRNRTDGLVVVTLRTRGDYSEMKLP